MCSENNYEDGKLGVHCVVTDEPKNIISKDVCIFFILQLQFM